MTEVKVEWNKQNVWDFVKFNSFSKTKGIKAVFITFLICFVLLFVGCIVAYTILGEPLMLISAAVLAAIVIAYGLIFYSMLKKYTKQILSANGGDEVNTVTLTDELIIVSRNDVPIGKLDWKEVVSISFNDKREAAYIMTGSNALLLLEYKNITGGTKEKLRELLEEKNAKLSKKAG